MRVLGKVFLIAAFVLASIGAQAASLSVSPSTLPAGGTVTATWADITTPTSTDWIGLFAPGAANNAYLSWRYTTGTASGNAPFDISGGLTPGTYELRLFAPGSALLANSGSFTVTAPPPQTLSASPASVVAGGSATATWANVATPTSNDWIGIFAPGAANNAYLAWRYTTGTASGNVPVDIPGGLTPGTYQLRLFAPGSTLLATSGNFSVTAPPPPTLSASPSSVAAGSSATATWANVATPTSTDWIGLFAPGAANNAYVAWRYTTGTASGNAPFSIPAGLTPGTYELRLFAPGSILLATSGNLAVTSPPPPALSVSPATVAPGSSLTASWSNIVNPTSTDWIGLFVPGAANTAYLAWRYTTGTANGNAPFSIPSGLAPGTYQLRLFAPGAILLATSGNFNIALTKIYYIHPDHLNTPRLVADSTGTTIWKWDQQEPFGNNPADENPSGLGSFDLPLRLPGQYYDKETNQHDNWMRTYDPGSGRYGQSDPIGLLGGLGTYTYVGSRPLNASDPTGQCPWCFAGAIIGGGINLYSQLQQNNGNWSQVNLVAVALSAGTGAIGGGAGAFIYSKTTSVLANALLNGTVNAASNAAATAIQNAACREDQSVAASAALNFGLGFIGGAGSAALANVATRAGSGAQSWLNSYVTNAVNTLLPPKPGQIPFQFQGASVGTMITGAGGVSANVIGNSISNVGPLVAP